MTTRARAALGEDTTAATRAVISLSLAAGGLAAGAATLIGDPLSIIALPALAVLAALLWGSLTAAAHASAAVWLVFALRAEGEALLVPLAMLLACLAIGFGPERLQRWLAAPVARPPSEPDRGWIEED